MKFALLGIEGLEDLHQDELTQFKIRNIEKYKGIIFFECEYDDKLKEIKTADDILIFAKKIEGINRYRKSLGTLRNQLREYYIGYEAKTFSVKVSYIGRRDYTAKEVEVIIYEEISTKYKWKLVKETGDVHINLIMHPDVSVLGVSIDDLPLYVKNKMETVPGSLRSSLANCIVKIAEVRQDEKILDPMCGSGILPIVAAKIGAKSYGMDIEKDFIDIAKKNAKDCEVNFQEGNALNTGYEDKYFDKIICNLPFGKQVKKDFDMSKFLDEMKRISKKDARWVLLSKETIKGLENRKIVNSGLELYLNTYRV